MGGGDGLKDTKGAKTADLGDWVHMVRKKERSRIPKLLPGEIEWCIYL